MKPIQRLLIVLIFFSSIINSTLSYSRQEKKTTEHIQDGWNFIDTWKLEKAKNSFLGAVDLEADNVRALEGLGLTYLYLDQYNESEEIFNQILELDEENVIAYIGLARLYSWSDRFEESINLYKKALTIDPGNADIKRAIAEAYSWWGEYKTSISEYEKILTEDPRNLKAYKGLAEVYSWTNQLNEAEIHYQRVLEISSEDIEARLGLAKIYGWMGRWQIAKKEYQKVLVKEPDNLDAQKGLKNAQKALLPVQDFSFIYINEKDAGDFRAHTLSYGYKRTKYLDYGNRVYAAYYFNDLRESGKTDSIGNLLEIGGTYHLKNWFALSGAADFKAYSKDPQVFAGGKVQSIFKYGQKNALTFRYGRELFDILDNIREQRYGVESNFYLNNSFLLTDSYHYSDYSDGNESEDSYHNLTFLISKRKPDLNVSLGYRNRDFKEDSSNYFSPDRLESIISSIFLGKSIQEHYVYGLFKFYDNSDKVDNFYYLLGSDYTLNDSLALNGEVSYFETTEKYSALTVSLSGRLRY